MILFKEDWLKYPTAIIDTQTTNRTALEMAVKLKMMGVSNNAFFLALHNPALQGVDPYSPNLTLQQMAAIGIECKINPWYVLREIARAPALAGTVPKRIEVNRSNLALWWCFFNHIFIILTQPRQTGKSFNTDWLMTTLMNFVCNNTQINLMTKDDKLRSDNISRLKNIYDELPTYLKFKTKEDANNTEELSIKKFGNTYKTHVPQASPKRAYNLGRGMTTPIFHIDEGPFQPNIGTAMGAALMAMGAAIDAAKASNEPYGVIMTTTAGKIDDKDGGYIYDMVEKSALWTEAFYDSVNADELEQRVRRNARGGAFRVYACFSYQQLGKDDAWARDQLERSTLAGDDANRDLFNMWTSGSSRSPIPTRLIESMQRTAIDATKEHIYPIGAYMLRWYVPEDMMQEYLTKRKLIVGIDTSDASGGDDIALVIVDSESGAVVAVGNFNETNLITFARWIVYLVENYTNMTFIIERRSSGITILDYLLLMLPERGIDPYKRLFNWVANDPLEYKERFAEASMPISRRPEDTYVRSKKYFGFATSGGGQTSRTELYSTVLQEAAKRCHNRIHDRMLVSQISGLVEKNGRIDHADGKHDDLVIAWLLCNWFLTKSKNISYYGFNPRNILLIKDEARVLSREEEAEEIIQKRIRARIDAIGELMVDCSDDFMVQRYEAELKYLDSQLILKDGEDFSLATFLDEMRDQRSTVSYRKAYGDYNQSYQPEYVKSRIGGIDNLYVM